jgi:membrane associated rhomboid family serine protease
MSKQLYAPSSVNIDRHNDVDRQEPTSQYQSMDVEGKYEDYTPDNNATDDDENIDNEVYIVRQNYGYCSILFSLAQTTIMVLMIWKCGLAPLKLNPMIGPYPDVLSEWGAKNTVLILDDNQWWRLETPILLHAGIIHLLCNVAVQLETGVFFEKEWGSWRWLLVYLVSALSSSLLSCIAMPNALSVGSSGAVMGLFGAKLSEVLLRACEKVRTKQDRVGHQVRKEQCCVVSCCVIITLAFSFIPYVDWAAHVGGVVGGILIGIPIFACEIESRLWKSIWFVVGTAATLLTFAGLIEYLFFSGEIIPSQQLRDICAYYKEQMGGYQCKCQRNGGQRYLQSFTKWLNYRS